MTISAWRTKKVTLGATGAFTLPKKQPAKLAGIGDNSKKQPAKLAGILTKWHESCQNDRERAFGTLIARLRLKTQLRILRQQRKLRKLR